MNNISPRNKITNYLKSLYPVTLTFWGTVLVALLGVADFFTGPEIGFSIFYLGPILMVTVFAGAGPGYLISILSAITWLVADVATVKVYTDILISIWNMAMRLGFFSIIVYTVSALKVQNAKLQEHSEQLEDVVKERTLELQASNKELEQMSYSVSHGMKQPLQVIKSYCSRALETYAEKVGPDGRRLLEVIRYNALTMGELMDGILVYLKLRQSDMKKTDIDMGAVAGEVFKELSASVPERAIKLDVGALPVFSGDADMMRQVWINLLSNAIKFTRDREQALIEVGGSTEGGENIYYVKDNGAGFDMKYVNKLFGPFQKLTTDGKFEGIGMGLAFVKRMIERHGGWVWAEGRINEGATFYFAVPRMGYRNILASR